ncbi:MAG: GFA family protein [bacterium]
MSEAKRYRGGCHCGGVRFTVETALTPVIECNCSICKKRGHLLTFVGADAMTLEAGDDTLTDYRFNTGKIAHLFCPTCGVGAYGRGTGRDGKPMYAINVRCLDGVELGGLSVTPYDGASM